MTSFFFISDSLWMGYHVVFLYSSPFYLHLFLLTVCFKKESRTTGHHAYSDFLTLPFRPQKIIWHGSTANGIRLVSSYCEAWHTADMRELGQASQLKTGKLLDQKVYSCSNQFIVLCIENSFVSEPQGK